MRARAEASPASQCLVCATKTRRRMILRIIQGAPSATKIQPCTGRARAQAARSELEPRQSRARAEPVQARAEASPASQCLVCATKTRRRMILRIIQGRASATKIRPCTGRARTRAAPAESSSLARAEPELSRSGLGPTALQHRSVWSVPRRRAGE